MYYSIIDIGANTIKLGVYLCKNGKIESVFFDGHTVGILAYTEKCGDERLLNQDGIILLCNIISQLYDKACEYNEKNIYAFATASLRNISNGSQVIKAVFDIVGINIDIISASEEAECSLKGMLIESDDKNGIMVDMGGGSTEVVLFHDGKVCDFVSFDFGCLSLYKLFVKNNIPTKKESENISLYVREKTEKISFISESGLALYLVGGTACAVENLCRCEKNQITIDDFRKVQKLSYETLKKLIPKRKNTVIPGAIAYEELICRIAPLSIHISKSGVREGYLYKKLEKMV